MTVPAGDEPEAAYPTPAEHFSARLRELRGTWSLRELADRTTDLARRLGTSGGVDKQTMRGVSKSVIARIEAGTYPPSERSIRLLDEALGAHGTLAILGDQARNEPYLHLPPPPAHFVGRDSELAALRSLAEARPPSDGAPTVLVIGGPPGMGKTALALRWANSMQELFDVALYAGLKGYGVGEPATPIAIIADLLHGLGIETDRMPGTLQEREALLREHLCRREQRMLVVLDNARDAQQVLPVLPHLAAATVLVTSRSQLSALVIDYDAEILRLDTLEDDDAFRLASQILGDDLAEEEPDAIAQLIDLCGSLPLAVLIAAERIAADPDINIQHHLAALSDLGRRLHLLDLDADDHSVGVRAAFGASLRALGPAAARMFRLLSVHPGPSFCRGMASAIAGVSKEEGLRLLEDLVEAHLLERLPGLYFRFHDLLRVYAAEEAAAGDRHESREAGVRLVRCFLHTANAASCALTPSRDHHVRLPPPPGDVQPGEFNSFKSAYAWCVRELPNFVPMIRLALQEELLFDAWRLPVEWFDFFTHSRPSELWIASFRLAVDAARQTSDPLRLAEAQEKLAEGHRRQGDIEEARALDVEAMRACAPFGPSRTLGFALLGLGNNASLDENHTEALTLTALAVSTFEAAGSWLGEATGRISLGGVHRALGNYGMAIAHGELASTMFLARDDDHGAAVALLSLARTRHYAGDLGRALDSSEQAHTRFHATADSWGQADALELNGRVLTSLGDPIAAAQHLTRALELVEGRDEKAAKRLLAAIEALPVPSPPPGRH